MCPEYPDQRGQAALTADLHTLGVEPGDTLMVHCSMRAVGGRAEHLIDALQDAVGASGTLLMLVCSPEDEPFDAVRSPAWTELGVLSEVFRTRPGVVLNAHPVARMGAWGRDAEALIQNAPLDDYYGPGSPLERLVATGGKVLRLGADLDTVTLFHHAEYVAEVADKRRRRWEVDVVEGGATRRVRGSCLDDDTGIRDWDGERDYFAQILLDYMATGVPLTGRVGGARAELLDAADAVRFAARWMERAFA